MNTEIRMTDTTKKITTTFMEVRQPFKKVVRRLNHDTTTMNEGFMLREKKQILFINTDTRKTICILDDGVIGESKCDKLDVFNETKGIKIAYLRARIKQMQNELEKLVE